MNLQILFFLKAEILCLGAICFILLVQLFRKEKIHNFAYFFTVLTMVLLAWLVIHDYPKTRSVLFSGHWIYDRLSATLKITIALGYLISLLYSYTYLLYKGLLKLEFFILSLFAVLGMMIVVSAGSFLSLYLGIELIALPIYSLIVLNEKTKLTSEAAIKYFVIGGSCAAIFLFGVSLIYGVSGNVIFGGISKELIYQVPNTITTLQIGLLFVLIGLLVEFGAVPVHYWLPDVYQSAPTTVVLLISSLPKIAAFGMAYRLFEHAFFELSPAWQTILQVIACISLTIGNLAAMYQFNFKRMLGYSTVSQVGFILMGLLCAPEQGFAAAMFYTFSYVLTILLVFAVIIYMANLRVQLNTIDDFCGLSQRYPYLCFILATGLFSLAGIPPLLGFMGKLVVLQKLVANQQYFIAIYALIMSVIGAYYYLRVIYKMYFVELSDQKYLLENANVYKNNQVKSMSIVMLALLIVNSSAVLLLGIYPTNVITWCINSFVV